MSQRRAILENLQKPSRRDTAPLWRQIRTTLQQAIADQKLPPHSLLPSEAELSQALGVSRPVVRDAIQELVHARQVYKVKGKGSFTAPHVDHQSFIGLTVGFSGELATKNKSVTRRVLLQEIHPAEEPERNALHLEEGQPVVAIDRVLSVDGVPRMYVCCRIDATLVPGLEKEPMEIRSLYECLGTKFGMEFARAERTLEALTVEGKDAEALDLPPGSPVIGIESVAFDRSGRATEYYHALFRTDHAKLHFQAGSG